MVKIQGPNPRTLRGGKALIDVAAVVGRGLVIRAAAVLECGGTAVRRAGAVINDVVPRLSSMRRTVVLLEAIIAQHPPAPVASLDALWTVACKFTPTAFLLSLLREEVLVARATSSVDLI